jgi:hypothetical protein
MNDKMTQGDQVAVKLDCGHPNKNVGELCDLCGQTVPGVAAETEVPSQPTSSESKSEPADHSKAD